MTRLSAATFSALLAACAASPGHVGALEEVERVRISPASKEAEGAAPQAFADAEGWRAKARTVAAEGDAIGASLLAEHALASYARAVVRTRLVLAEETRQRASSRLSKESADLARFEAARTQADHEGEALTEKLKVARAALSPVPSGPVDADREAARLVAARSMLAEARLLSGAVRALDPANSSLPPLDTYTDRIEGELMAAKRGPTGPLIDRVARLREEALTLLTKTRRARGGGGTESDSLLGELAQAAIGTSVHRDDRGVVVTVAKAFDGGGGLTPDAAARLKRLGAVATSHPSFHVQIVVHEARGALPPRRAASPRVDAVVSAFGAPEAARIDVENVGGAMPLLDPSLAGAAAENERVDVVFVSP